MNNELRILVVTPELTPAGQHGDDAIRQAECSSSIRIGLLENGFNLIAAIAADTFLCERLAQLQPDLIIVDAESEARDALEHVVVATRHERRPIVMFTNDKDTSHLRDAVAAGVTAYVVAGLSADRMRPILAVAMARFRHEQAMRRQLTEMQNQLDQRTAQLQERKLIDRAKGLLMQRQRLTEQQAYEKLRKNAMDQNLRLAELARRMLGMGDLLG